MSYKDGLGIITIIIAILSYSFYFRDILDSETKPHAFSWLVWGILMTIAFFTQNSAHAGPGAWVTGFTALICFTICIVAFSKKLKNIKFVDYFSLAGALVTLVVWFLVKNSAFSIILITITYSFGFFPTFRKSYSKPQNETVVTFALNGFKFFLALFALDSFNFTTAFYPIILVLVNWSFVLLLILRDNAIGLKPRI